jgi:hypothetical protein
MPEAPRTPLQKAIRKRANALRSIQVRKRSIAALEKRVAELDAEIASYTKIRGTNLGRTPTGVGTTIITTELNKMMKKDPFALYWKQGVGPVPPKPPSE